MLTRSDEVKIAYDGLLNSTEALVNKITDEGQRAIEVRDYQQATHMLEKAKVVAIFVEQVQSLRLELDTIWQIPTQDAYQAVATSSLQDSAPKSKDGIQSQVAPTSHARTNVSPMVRGERTPEDTFRIPILEILVEAGGSARKQDVEKVLLERMRSVFKPADFEGLSSRTNQIRWSNTAQWCRAKLVEEGLMESNSPRGVWAISDAGRLWLEHSR